MQKIRFSILTALFVLLTFSIVTYTSCTVDKCDNLVCLNGGSCTDGVCKCPTGYSGVLCEDEPVVVDPCANVVCQNGGTCNNGTCSCPTGYEGTNCETLSRAKFIGIYSGSETCTVGSDTYMMTAIAHTDNSKFTLTNLYNITGSLDVVCTITGTNTFSFSGSNTSLGVNSYSGTGTINNNQLTVTYTLTGTGGTNTCTYTGTK